MGITPGRPLPDHAFRCCEDGCSRMFACIGIVAGALCICVLVIPYSWANPFDGKNDGSCEDPSAVTLAWLLPILLGLPTCSFIVPFCNGNCDSIIPALGCTAVGFLAAVGVSIALLASAQRCDGDSRSFVLSVALIFFIPASLLSFWVGTLWLLTWNGTGGRVCPRRFCHHRRSFRRRPLAKSKATAAKSAPKGKRPRRAQLLLREAFILGDPFLANLLLDFQGRAGDPLWRMYRCLFLTFCRCQCRCSCLVGSRDRTSRDCPSAATNDASGQTRITIGPSRSPTQSRAFVQRASLLYVHEDEGGDLPIHYLSRGASHGYLITSVSSAEVAAELVGCCMFWRSKHKASFLPELTDERRAKLLRDLVNSQQLPAAHIFALNFSGQTPLHCAAETGSEAVVASIISLLDPISGSNAGRNALVVGVPRDDAESGQGGRLGVHLANTDGEGNTPCEVALKNGFVLCAHLLVGAHGVWPGLPSIPRRREVLRSCLSGALGHLSSGDSTPCYDVDTGIVVDVHDGPHELLSRLQMQIQEVQSRCSDIPLPLEVSQRGKSKVLGDTALLLPVNAVEALLKFHRYDVDETVKAFQANPREALDTAGLKGVRFPLVAGNATVLDSYPGWEARCGDSALPALQSSIVPRWAGGALRSTSGKCMVCFDDIAIVESACRLLPCRHITCDDCLGTHIRVRLDEGDEAGIVCPEPLCKLPISVNILVILFGKDSPQQRKLETLKAHTFVDTQRNMTWCPSPRCSRAVSLPRTYRHVGNERQASDRPATTVSCECGTQFCFSCKELQGHEPVGCQQWKDWLVDLVDMHKQMQDPTQKWLKENSKTCTCGASIQRTGGCNHMICTCNRHFCYVCGQDWSIHKQQPGGFDYYSCRMRPSGADPTRAFAQTKPTRGKNLIKLEQECLPGWMANARQVERQRSLFRAFLHLASEFNLALGIEESGQNAHEDVENASVFFSASSSVGARRSSWEISEACLGARKCLQRCYVLKYSWSEDVWRRTRLQTWVPELESAVSALEAVIGIVLLDKEASDAGFPSQLTLAEGGSKSDKSAGNSNGGRVGKSMPKEPSVILQYLDLRVLLPHVIAVVEHFASIRQLAMAVSLQTARILACGRMGFPECGYIEDIIGRTAHSFGVPAPSMESMALFVQRRLQQDCSVM